MILDLQPFKWSTTLDWYSEFQREEDDKILLDIKLPGVKKEDIQLSYNQEHNYNTVFVKDKVDKTIGLYRTVDPDKIEAELELGILKVKAPLKNSNKIIQIK